ncbi:YopX family protein [Mycolicibacterium neoaurum]|uniref:YopX family protein n=1 Tax=Mycolicibacterium neoaurum TaxID=1795 RepID=UPI001F4C6826|nr:YopX family protein [Mycolicibacterium neoaurum]
MTPPLKYRAYHHKSRQYIAVRNIVCNAQGQPIAISTGGLDAPRVPISELTLERWTGRYDRAGNEVFEGDIIQRYINPAGEYYYASTLSVVEWQDNARYTGWGLTDRTERRIEVVGNKHQHAHLLTAGVAA